MSATRMSYVGRCAHGKMRCAIVDDPECRDGVARFCADAVRRGLTLERVTTEEARSGDWRCNECKPQRRKPADAAPSLFDAADAEEGA